VGLLDLADGRFEQALDRLDEVCGGPAQHDVLIRAVPDQVEAAIRAGRGAMARRHLPRLAAWAENNVLGKALEARCQAMLADGDAADRHYRAALVLGADRRMTPSPGWARRGGPSAPVPSWRCSATGPRPAPWPTTRSSG
jgi:uncharacterized protein HemY